MKKVLKSLLSIQKDLERQQVKIAKLIALAEAEPKK